VIEVWVTSRSPMGEMSLAGAQQVAVQLGDCRCLVAAGKVKGPTQVGPVLLAVPGLQCRSSSSQLRYSSIGSAK
jgi:hypothetical protein